MWTELRYMFELVCWKQVSNRSPSPCWLLCWKQVAEKKKKKGWGGLYLIYSMVPLVNVMLMSYVQWRTADLRHFKTILLEVRERWVSRKEILYPSPNIPATHTFAPSYCNLCQQPPPNFPPPGSCGSLWPLAFLFTLKRMMMEQLDWIAAGFEEELSFETTSDLPAKELPAVDLMENMTI